MFHATHGADGSGMGLDGLSRDGNRIPCFMAWQLDGGRLDPADPEDEWPSYSTKTRRIRIFNRDNGFQPAHIALVDNGGMSCQLVDVTGLQIGYSVKLGDQPLNISWSPI